MHENLSFVNVCKLVPTIIKLFKYLFLFLVELCYKSNKLRNT